MPASRSSRSAAQKKARAEELYQQALAARSFSRKAELIREVLDLVPDHPGALEMHHDLISDIFSALRLAETDIRKEETKLRKQGWFDPEYRGEFWLILETRPYMHLRYSFLTMLAQLGMYRRAVQEANELLELCEGDNLGVRYLLMGLYVFLEDEEGLNRIYEKYPEDGPETLLSRSIMMFKLGREKEAAAALNKISIEGLEEFLNALVEGEAEDLYEEEYEDSENGYIFGSLSHLISILTDWEFLTSSVQVYFLWAVRTLKKAGQKKDAVKTKKTPTA